MAVILYQPSIVYEVAAQEVSKKLVAVRSYLEDKIEELSQHAPKEATWQGRRITVLNAKDIQQHIKIRQIHAFALFTKTNLVASWTKGFNNHAAVAREKESLEEVREKLMKLCRKHVTKYLSSSLKYLSSLEPGSSRVQQFASNHFSDFEKKAIMIALALLV